jgi:hypothetical protein
MSENWVDGDLDWAADTPPDHPAAEKARRRAVIPFPPDLAVGRGVGQREDDGVEPAAAEPPD